MRYVCALYAVCCVCVPNIAPRYFGLKLKTFREIFILGFVTIDSCTCYIVAQRTDVFGVCVCVFASSYST